MRRILHRGSDTLRTETHRHTQIEEVRLCGSISIKKVPSSSLPPWWNVIDICRSKFFFIFKFLSRTLTFSHKFLLNLRCN